MWLAVRHEILVIVWVGPACRLLCIDHQNIGRQGDKDRDNLDMIQQVAKTT
jgi:hypothetical protein